MKILLIIEFFKCFQKTIRIAVKSFNDVKMTNSNSNFFQKFFKLEFKATTYFEYTDIKKFRRFRLSFLIFKWYLVYHRHCTQRTAKIFLNFLKNFFNLNDVFFSKFSLIIKKIFYRAKYFQKRKKKYRQCELCLCWYFLRINFRHKKFRFCFWKKFRISKYFKSIWKFLSIINFELQNFQNQHDNHSVF